MENLVGRYIKVLKHCLGGNSSRYKVGDYLKVEKKITESGCYSVEYAGMLSLQTTGGNRVTNGDVEIMPIGWKPEVNYFKLSSFPSTGVCWNPTQELLDYLKNRSAYDNLRDSFTNFKGLAWSPDRVWGVVASSSQVPYDISQLEPFFKKYEFPKKWYLETDEHNAEMLTEFMREHKEDWKHYKDSWYVWGKENYFHYPPIGEPAHSALKPHKDYTEITTEQFIKQFKIKQNEQESRKTNERTIDRGFEESSVREHGVKICRPNLEIRSGGEIRATSFRCSKGKIDFRS